MNNTLYPEAIEKNRAGHFSMSQAGGLLGVTLLGLFLILIGVGIVVIDPANISGIDIAACLLFLWMGYKVGGVLVLDIVLGTVGKIEGKGQKSISSSGKNLRRTYWVGEQYFEVPSSALFDKLDNHDHVRLYYLPCSRTLINLEW